MIQQMIPNVLISLVISRINQMEKSHLLISGFKIGETKIAVPDCLPTDIGCHITNNMYQKWPGPPISNNCRHAYYFLFLLDIRMMKP